MSERNRTKDRGASGMSPLLTHEEVGSLMGISGALSEKTERQALGKIRALLKEFGYEPADLFPPSEHRQFVRERVRQDADGMGKNQ